MPEDIKFLVYKNTGGGGYSVEATTDGSPPSVTGLTTDDVYEVFYGSGSTVQKTILAGSAPTEVGQAVTFTNTSYFNRNDVSVSTTKLTSGFLYADVVFDAFTTGMAFLGFGNGTAESKFGMTTNSTFGVKMYDGAGSRDIRSDFALSTGVRYQIFIGFQPNGTGGTEMKMKVYADGVAQTLRTANHADIDGWDLDTGGLTVGYGNRAQQGEFQGDVTRIFFAPEYLEVDTGITTATIDAFLNDAGGASHAVEADHTVAHGLLSGNPWYDLFGPADEWNLVGDDGGTTVYGTNRGTKPLFLAKGTDVVNA